MGRGRIGTKKSFGAVSATGLHTLKEQQQEKGAGNWVQPVLQMELLVVGGGGGGNGGHSGGGAGGFVEASQALAQVNDQFSIVVGSGGSGGSGNGGGSSGGQSFF